ncbi:HDIG domain-containing metalloprotein [Clostridium butyricum]|uniref:HDIG domain-containing metalloprotein n=1 Tax=Clostridium butyricum TaxID=1492 RepID=UPI00129ABF19|nr:HDIG domain-containing metalloprotein [Clostridium butyricum]QGH23934.1 HD domain-containing protein [Clostridium butyricum]QGH27979.1 HD domain-containing protein [Clostridium butyricum]
MKDKDYEIFLEIEKHLLNDDKPSLFLKKLADEKLLNNYPLSMIGDLQDVEQNPKYHPEGNVFIHTMMVIDEGAINREKSNDKRAFMWSLLLHDVGKKPTTKMRRGRLTSYDHDRVGKDMAEKFLEYFNQDNNFVDKVIGLVRWHMQSLFVTKDSKFQNIDEMLKDVDVNEIVLVALADRLGRGNLDNFAREETINEINSFEEKLIKYKK